MNRLNPEATFDCLFIIERLQGNRTSLTSQEIHLFAYLGCLLWIYRKRPVEDWGYGFVGTELGAPFSQEIDTSINELVERGYLRRVHGRVDSTEIASDSLRYLTALASNTERIECLDAACSSTAAFSVGMVSNALTNEPELSRAQAVPSSRMLLEETARSQLYEQFDALRSALDQRGDDLRLPAVVWLSALYQMDEGV
jgi:hypothetical protein